MVLLIRFLVKVKKRTVKKGNSANGRWEMNTDAGAVLRAKLAKNGPETTMKVTTMRMTMFETSKIKSGIERLMIDMMKGRRGTSGRSGHGGGGGGGDGDGGGRGSEGFKRRRW